MKTVILFSVLALAVASIVPDEQTCLEEAETGMCRAYMPMLYYDYKSRSCKEFIYGGCGGNGNRYVTEEDCMNKCGDVVVFESDTDVCELPAETGHCLAYFRKFYFDKATGECKKFVYGGCGGNGNRFDTVEECQNRCAARARAAPSACLQEKKVGLCKGHFIRYYFNKDTGNCEEFVYGGCMGNSNNFLSKEDCEGVCKS